MNAPADSIRSIPQNPESNSQINKLRPTIQRITEVSGLQPEYFDDSLRQLPLEVTIVDKPFTVGYHNVNYRDGRLTAEIGFKQEEMLEGEKPADQWVRAEETFHYMHSAHNPSLARENALFELNRKWTTDMARRDQGKDAVLFSKVDLNTRNAIREFIDETGIDYSPPERIDLVLRSLGVDSNGQDIQGGDTLSFIEMLNLYKVLLDRQIRTKFPHLTEDEVKQEIERELENPIKEWIAGNAGIDAGLMTDDSKKEELGISNVQSGRSRLKYGLKRLAREILQANSPEENRKGLDILSEAFQEAGVNPDRLKHQVESVEKRIDNLTQEEVVNALKNILNKNLSNERVDALAGSISEDMDIKFSVNRPKEITPEVVLERVKKDLEDLSETQIPIEKLQRLRYALVDQLRQERKEIVGQELMKQRAAWLMADLPIDKESARVLLHNPAYMQAWQQMVQENIDYFIQESLGIDIEEFIENTEYAAKSSETKTQEVIDDPELAAFMASIESHMKYQRSMGSVGEDLEMRALNHRDRAYLEARMGVEEFSSASVEQMLEGYSPSLSERSAFFTEEDGQKADIAFDQVKAILLGEIKKEDLTAASERAQREAMHTIKLSGDLDDRLHIHHMMMEPIAKVIAAKVSGQPREAIEFPSTMLGGYSSLLRGEKMQKWVDFLWQFVDEVKGRNRTDLLQEFLQQNDLNGQINIVARLFPKVRSELIIEIEKVGYLS